MSHYPLYRKSDAHCQEPDGAPPEDKGDTFREGWDCLTRAASTLLLKDSASKISIRKFVITEKAATRAFSWLKAATTTFTFKTLLRL